MATTRQQVQQLTGMAARRMAGEFYPIRIEVTRALMRAIVSEAKRIGTPRARLTMKAALREIYVDIFGEEPVGKREFVHWVRGALVEQATPLRDLPAHPFDNVTQNDGFDAVLEDIS